METEKELRKKCAVCLSRDFLLLILDVAHTRDKLLHVSRLY